MKAPGIFITQMNSPKPKQSIQKLISLLVAESFLTTSLLLPSCLASEEYLPSWAAKKTFPQAPGDLLRPTTSAKDGSIRKNLKKELEEPFDYVQLKQGSSADSTHVQLLQLLLHALPEALNAEFEEILRKGRVLNIGLETNIGGILQNSNMVSYLRAHGVDAIGLDPQVEENVEQGLVKGVVQEMPFPEDSFDLVVSAGLFNPEFFDLSQMHKQGYKTPFAFYSKAAEQIKRILRSDGKFLVSLTAPNPEFISAFRDAGFEMIPLLDVSHGYLLVNQKSVRDGGARLHDGLLAQRSRWTPLSPKTKVSEHAQLAIHIKLHPDTVGTDRQGIILTVDGIPYFAYTKDIEAANKTDGRKKIQIFELLSKKPGNEEIVPLRDPSVAPALRGAMRLFSSFVTGKQKKAEEIGLLLDVLYLPDKIQLQFGETLYTIDRKTGHVSGQDGIGEKRDSLQPDTYLFLAGLPLIMNADTHDEVLEFYRQTGGRLDAILFAPPGTFDVQDDDIPSMRFEETTAFGMEGEQGGLFEPGLNVVKAAERLVNIRAAEVARRTERLRKLKEARLPDSTYVQYEEGALAGAEQKLNEAKQIFEAIGQMDSLEEMFAWIREHAAKPTPLQQEALEAVSEEMSVDPSYVFFIEKESLLGEFFNFRMRGLHGVLNLGGESSRITLVDSGLESLPRIVETLIHESLHGKEAPLTKIPLKRNFARYLIEGITQDHLTETMRALLARNTPFSKKLEEAMREETARHAKEDILHTILLYGTIMEDRETGKAFPADPVSEWLATNSIYYRIEREFARALSETVGHEVLETLYARGDALPLKEALGTRFHFLEGLSTFLTDPPLKRVLYHLMVQVLSRPDFDKKKYQTAYAVLSEVTRRFDEKRASATYQKFTEPERYQLELILREKLHHKKIVHRAIEAKQSGTLERGWIKKETEILYLQAIAKYQNYRNRYATDGGGKGALIDQLWEAIRLGDEKQRDMLVAGLKKEPMTWASVLLEGVLTILPEVDNEIAALSEKLGFSKDERKDIGISVTELAMNAMQHAAGGAVVARQVHSKGRTGIEITVVDRAKEGLDKEKITQIKLPDVKSKSGRGLYLVKNLMDDLQIDSRPGVGTKVTVVKWFIPYLSDAELKRFQKLEEATEKFREGIFSFYGTLHPSDAKAYANATQMLQNLTGEERIRFHAYQERIHGNLKNQSDIENLDGILRKDRVAERLVALLESADPYANLFAAFSIPDVSLDSSLLQRAISRLEELIADPSPRSQKVRHAMILPLAELDPARPDAYFVAIATQKKESFLTREAAKIVLSWRYPDKFKAGEIPTPADIASWGVVLGTEKSFQGKEQVPFAIGYTDFGERDFKNLVVPQISLLQVGSFFILDSRLKEKILEIDQVRYDKNLLFIHDLPKVLKSGNYPYHTAATIQALLSRKDAIVGKTVLDLGAAEGIQGLVVLHLGAKRVIGVDIDPKFSETIKNNLHLNRYPEEKFHFIAGDLKEKEKILAALEPFKDEISIVVETIGPFSWYKGANMAAIELTRSLPNVRLFFAGGYAEPNGIEEGPPVDDWASGWDEERLNGIGFKTMGGVQLLGPQNFYVKTVIAERSAKDGARRAASFLPSLHHQDALLYP